MDNKIIVNISMFDSFQKIKVYSNGLCIKKYACNLEDLSRSISTLVEQENCSRVNLFGSTNFLEKIKKDILAEYAKNYGNKNLIININ